MNIKYVGHMEYHAQDGAIFGNYAFRFDESGKCRVFDVTPLREGVQDAVLPLLSEFYIADRDAVTPHFNSVSFGVEKWEDVDEFPLLYANVYNNYSSCEDRREGVLCAYRIERRENEFSMSLVQVIEIGFKDDNIWRSDDAEDIRPYGNFVIERDTALLYAFTMRDGDHKTRYFSFRLPPCRAGEMSAEYGVPRLILTKDDILSYFDTEYHNFIQGACAHVGLIYSSEGFDEKIHPALRVIDPARQCQLAHIDLVERGYTVEAEWMDFLGERCLYSDADGDIYEVEFDI